MDLVYIYKRPRHGEGEILHSIRSAAKHLRFEQLFVVGDRPRFLGGEAIHVPDDGPGEKYANAFGKILKAARDPRVSETFALMNDDFFILRPHDTVEPYWHERLGEMRDRIPEGKRGTYWKALVDTIAIVGEQARSFAVHFPFPFEKAKLIATAERHGLPGRPLHFRTLYAAEHGITGHRRLDKKARQPADLVRWQHAPFLSTTDDLAQTDVFRRFIGRRFKDRCRFEK